MTFCYNVNQKKEINSSKGHCLCGVCMLFPCMHGFPPTSQRCKRELNWCVSTVPVWVSACERPFDGRASFPGWVLLCALSCPNTLWPLWPWTGIKWVGKYFSFFFKNTNFISLNILFIYISIESISRMYA